MVAEPAAAQIDLEFVVPVLAFASLDVVVVETFRDDQGSRSVGDDGSPVRASGVNFGFDDDFSRPGMPTDNAYIESFNGSVRAECLNENWFLSLEDARVKRESWRCDDNEQRPHNSLGTLAK